MPSRKLVSPGLREVTRLPAPLAARQLEIESTEAMMIGQMLRITKVRPNILTMNLRFRHTTTWEQCQESRNLLDIEVLKILGTDEDQTGISFWSLSSEPQTDATSAEERMDH
jgi:hypothetical protein